MDKKALKELLKDIVSLKSEMEFNEYGELYNLKHIANIINNWSLYPNIEVDMGENCLIICNGYSGNITKNEILSNIKLKKVDDVSYEENVRWIKIDRTEQVEISRLCTLFKTTDNPKVNDLHNDIHIEIYKTKVVASIFCYVECDDKTLNGDMMFDIATLKMPTSKS